MGRNGALALYGLAMVVLIVAVDLVLLRHQPWARLTVNVGIVLAFGACYVRFLK